jgi:hypothetical protein
LVSVVTTLTLCSTLGKLSWKKNPSHPANGLRKAALYVIVDDVSFLLIILFVFSQITGCQIPSPEPFVPGVFTLNLKSLLKCIER